MENGFNTDLLVMGQNYHVQTEDWGSEAAVIVTRIFKSGAVLKTFRKSYVDLLRTGHRDPKAALRLALAEQHQEILDQLARGELTIG